MRSKRSIAERFWPKVLIGESCWLWTSNTDKDGYGKLTTIDQTHVRAHVYAWWLATGEWPARGQIIGHTCDITGCVRNDEAGVYIVDGIEYRRMGHLWLGTVLANNQDKRAKGRCPMGDLSGPRIHIDAMSRGERHHRAKLTDALVRKLRQEVTPETNMAELAREHNVDQMTISRAVSGKTWRHL